MLLSASISTERSAIAQPRPGYSDPGSILLLDISNQDPTGLGDYLEKSGLTVREERSIEGLYGYQGSLSDDFDLIILVASLPSPSTLTVLRHLNRTDAPPVFVVALEGEALERVLALEVGADDLVGREANSREILARLHRIMSRKAERPRPTASDAAWTLRHAQRLLIAPGGQRINLTGRDHALLIALSDHADGVLMETDFAAGQIRTAISRLKRKVLMDAEIVLPIENVWGQGYRFDAPLVHA